MRHVIERNRICNPANLNTNHHGIQVDEAGNVRLRDCLIVLGGGLSWGLPMKNGDAVELENPPSGPLYLVTAHTWLQKLAIKLLFRCWPRRGS